jgi:DnaJ-class molecular chaperone
MEDSLKQSCPDCECTGLDGGHNYFNDPCGACAGTGNAGYRKKSFKGKFFKFSARTKPNVQ